MVSLPVKQQFRPTLGQLLSPRWRGLKPFARVLLPILALAFLAALVGGALTLRNSIYSHEGKISFSFEYKGLFKASPGLGAYVRVVRFDEGKLEDSFEVAPLELPPYRGSVTGILPLYVASYLPSLQARYGKSLRFYGEGKTRVNSLAAYDFFYSAVVGGRELYGRNVLITPEREGARGRGDDHDAHRRGRKPRGRLTHARRERRRTQEAARNVRARIGARGHGRPA